MQAALIAKQSKDPVKVIWNREEDIQHDMYRPYYYDRISAGLDKSGRIVAWDHRIVGSSIMARFFPAAFKDGIDPDAVDGAIELPYELPNYHVEYVREEPPGIRTAFWRGVGATRNAFVIESFIDELAAAAKRDPMEFRLEHTAKSPRAHHVIERVKEMSGWGSPLGPRRGRGVALLYAFETYMVHVAEVTVADNGEVRVDRVVVAVDTGVRSIPIPSGRRCKATSFSVSPERCGARSRSRTVASSSRTSTIIGCCASTKPRRSRSKLSKSQEKPGGIGEPGTSTVIPAVFNAVYAATGVRLRRMAIKPELLKV